MNAYVLEVHAVGFPCVVVGSELQFCCLTATLYLMAGHFLATGAAHGFQCAFRPRYVVPHNLIACLRIIHIVLPDAQRLAVLQKFHFLCIRVGDDPDFRCLFFFGSEVPVFCQLVAAHLDAVPVECAGFQQHADVHQRLVGEIALDEIGVGLRLERDVEHALRPSFLWPAIAFAQVVNHTPVSQSQHLVEVHLEVVRTHHRRVGLALIENHMGETLAVAREIHISVVVGGDVCLMHERCRQRVGVDVAATRVHGHCDGPLLVVAFQQLLLHPVGRHAPVSVGQVPVGLKLVAEAPHDDAGMIAVTLDEFRDVLLPELGPGLPASAVFVQPFVVELVYDKDAILVAQPQKTLAVGVVGCAYVVEPEVFQQFQAFLDGALIG